MVINIIILIAVIGVIFFIFRAVKDIRRKVEEKMKYAERIIKHPENIAAEIGASLIRTGFQGMKKAFRRTKTNNSTE